MLFDRLLRDAQHAPAGGSGSTAEAVEPQHDGDRGAGGFLYDPHLQRRIQKAFFHDAIGIQPIDGTQYPSGTILLRYAAPGEAKVIWAGVEASEPLDQLAGCVRNNLSAAGVPFDPKPFVPHITLGRKPIVPVAFDFSDMFPPS